MVHQNHEEEKNSSEFFEADPFEESLEFFSCLISDEIRHPRWGMLRVFSPEAEEERHAFFDPGAHCDDLN